MPILADTYYHLYEGGEALSPPIVLMHGIGGSHLDWPPDIRRLPGHRMYALDLPGHGKSRNPGCQSVAAYTEKLLDWLDAAGLYRAVFVGHSLGSSIALHLGCYHPNRVAGLVLIANEERNFIPPHVLEDIANPNTYLKGLRTLVGQYFLNPEINGGAHTQIVLQWFQANRPSVVYGDLLACNTFNLDTQLVSIQSPTLILSGECDPFSPLRRVHYMAKTIPNAHLVIVPQAGHLAIVEQPRFIVKALQQFLQTTTYVPGQG